MADTAFIACFEQFVPEQESRDLIVWLNKPEAKTLHRIVESRARESMAKVANAALQAAGDAPLKLTLADEHLKTARRYLDFLDIINRVREQTEPFTVSKWT